MHSLLAAETAKLCQVDGEGQGRAGFRLVESTLMAENAGGCGGGLLSFDDLFSSDMRGA